MSIYSAIVNTENSSFALLLSRARWFTGRSYFEFSVWSGNSNLGDIPYEPIEVNMFN